MKTGKWWPNEDRLSSEGVLKQTCHAIFSEAYSSREDFQHKIHGDEQNYVIFALELLRASQAVEKMGKNIRIT